MRGVIPRIVRLLQVQADGEDFRHLRLQIDRPLPQDAEVSAGQFFMLAVPGHGEAAFTYLTRPDAEGRFEALIRRVGEMTTALFAAVPGDVLGYRGPYGQGWPHLFGQQDVLLVAGGCGLAPMAGLIDETLAQRPEVSLRLLYSTRSHASEVLAPRRAAWHQRLQLVQTFDDAGDHPLAQVRALCHQRQPDLVLCCGPELFMQAVGETCCEAGIDPASIWLSVERRMHCAIGLCGHCHIGDTFACTDGPTYRYDRYVELIEGNGCLLAS